MSDLETRLRADGQAWQALIEEPTGPDLVPQFRNGRHLRGRGWIPPLATAAAVVLIGASIIATSKGLGRPASVATLSPAVSSGKSTPPTCGALSITALSRGQHLSHNNAQALDVVTSNHVGPTDVTGVYAALVIDPVAAKISPDWGSAPRPMWVIEGTSTVSTLDRPPESVPPVQMYPNGTVLHVITLVDDATMRLGGNTICGVASK